MQEKRSQKRIKRFPKGPRVIIGLEVEDAGSVRRKELPFVVGVMAPLSGSIQNDTPFRDRETHQIDSDNFAEVMEAVQPRVKFTPDGGIGDVDLTFTSMEAFEPQEVAKKIAPDLLEQRQMLTELLSRLSANARLSERLQQAIEGFEGRARLLREIRAGLVGPDSSDSGE